MKEIKKDQPQVDSNEEKQTGVLTNQQGKIGYLIAWMLGVPASVLFFIFLIRGH